MSTSTLRAGEQEPLDAEAEAEEQAAAARWLSGVGSPDLPPGLLESVRAASEAGRVPRGSFVPVMRRVG